MIIWLLPLEFVSLWPPYVVELPELVPQVQYWKDKEKGYNIQVFKGIIFKKGKDNIQVKYWKDKEKGGSPV